MSMYGPQDPYGQPGDPNAPRPPGPALPGDTQPQSGSSDPYQPPGYPDAPPPMHPGTPPHQPYGQPGYPDPYGMPPADNVGPVSAPGYPVSGPGMPPPVGGPGMPPMGPPGMPPPVGGPGAPQPQSGGNAGMWVLGGVGVVLVAALLVVVFVVLIPGGDSESSTTAATDEATGDVSHDEPSEEPSTQERTSSDPYAGMAEDDPRRGDIGDCVYAWPVNEDETRYDAILVDCGDSRANVYFYDIAWNTLDETQCPDSDYGAVQFWYWADLTDDTMDHVLCGYWIV